MKKVMKKMMFCMAFLGLFVSFSGIVGAAILDDLLIYHNFNDTTDQANGLFNISLIGNASLTNFNPFIRASGNMTNEIGTFFNTTGGNESFNFGDDKFTMVAWVYPRSFQSGAIFRKLRGGGGSGGWVFRINNSAHIEWSDDVNGPNGGSTNNLSVNTWSFIAVTQNSSNMCFWINGVIDNCVTNRTVPAEPSNSTLWIGSNTVDTQDGQIDEAGIWSRSLAASEMLSLYFFGAGSTYPFAPISLNNPANGTGIISSTVFNASVNPGADLINNGTFIVWYANGSILNETTVAITGTSLNESTLNITVPFGANFEWNFIVGLQNESNNYTARLSSNATFNSGFFLNSHTFNSEAAALSSQTFILNLTLISGLSSSQATFIYNNTNFLVTGVSDGLNTIYTGIVTAPSVISATNIAFRWELNLNDGVDSVDFNVTSGTQQINSISIDDCSSFNNVVINYTLRDEQDQSFITPNGNTVNTTIEVEFVLSNVDDASVTFTFNDSFIDTNTVSVCVSDDTINNTEYRYNAQTRYVSTDRVSEFHNIQNATLTNNTATQNINLLDLATASSQEFIITFKDENFLPVSSAILTVTRKYIEEGTFKTVEAPLTDTDGKAATHLQLSNTIYTFVITKQGKTLATFTNIVPICQNPTLTDCTINLNKFAVPPQPFDFGVSNNLAYTLFFNSTTRVLTSIFNTLDGTSSTVSLNATRFDSYGNTTVCSSQLVTSAGTLTCIVPASFGNASVIAELYKDGTVVTQSFFSLQLTPQDIFGPGRIIMVAILFITLPLMALTSGPATIVFAMMGLVMAGLLNIFSAGANGTLIGTGATILWFLIAGGVILWRISRK